MLKSYDAVLTRIYKNLGDLYDKTDAKKALEYYGKAFQYDDKNDAIFILYTDHLFGLELYDLLKQVCEQAKCGEVISKVINTHRRIAIGEINVETVDAELADIRMNPTDHAINLGLLSKQYMTIGNYQKAEIYLNQLSNILLIKGPPMDECLINMLVCYIHDKKPEAVINFALKEKFTSDGIWRAHILVVCFRINAHLQLGQISEAIELFQLVAQEGLIDIQELLIDYVFPLAGILGTQDLFLRTLEFISLVNPSISGAAIQVHQELFFVASSAEVPIDTATKPTCIPDIFLKDGIQVNEEEAVDHEWKDYDPKKAHKFYQERESNFSGTKKRSGQVDYSWVVDGVEYSDANNNIYKVDDIFFPKHRTDICPNVDGSRFLIAIESGLCYRAYGVDGVKRLSNGMFELKHAKCNDRVLARILYDNPDGARLVLFKEIKNHTKIDIICRKQEVRIIQL